MNCPRCGCALPDDSEFCQYCGAKLSSEVESTTMPDIQTAGSSNQDTQQPSQLPLPSSGTETVFPPQKAEASGGKKELRKFCGGLIGPEAKRCFPCGKQFFKFSLKTISITVLILALIALAGLNVYQYISNNSIIAGLEQQLETVKQEIESKNATIIKQQSTISTQRNEINELNSSLKSVRELLWDSLDKSIFMDDYVVIVADDGTKQYHKYGCEDLDLSYFWVYNEQAAISKGYHAHSNCCN